MPLPSVITDQDQLLTINSDEQPWIHDFPVPGSHICPLFLDPQNGIWVLRVKVGPGIVLPNHFHTGTVHLYTMTGRWNYVQYPDQPQTDGCYLYEPGGSIHQFMTPIDGPAETDTLMVIQGANVNFDADGQFTHVVDAGFIEAMLTKVAAERGMSPLKYIRSLGANYSVA